MKPTVETVKLTVIRGRIESMSTLTITEFLEARIAEDEAMARAVVDGPNWTSDEESYVVLHDDSGICYDIASEEVSQHIARHDPARVLAECSAKRAIIKHAEDVHDSYREDQFAGGAYAERIVGREGWVYPFDLSPVLSALAAVYADHPDYRQEWAL